MSQNKITTSLKVCSTFVGIAASKSSTFSIKFVRSQGTNFQLALGSICPFGIIGAFKITSIARKCMCWLISRCNSSSRAWEKEIAEDLG